MASDSNLNDQSASCRPAPRNFSGDTQWRIHFLHLRKEGRRKEQRKAERMKDREKREGRGGGRKGKQEALFGPVDLLGYVLGRNLQREPSGDHLISSQYFCNSNSVSSKGVPFPSLQRFG